MKRIFALALALAMVLAVMTGCSQPAAPADSAEPDAPASDTSWDDIVEKGYFIVGLDDSFPPMGYRDESNEIIGFDIDLAKAVAAYLGIEVKFQPVIWDNIAMEIENKNVDVIWNGCTITAAREEVFDFSEPYMANKQVVVVLDGAPYQTLSDLSGKKVGTQSGSAGELAIEGKADFAAAIDGVTGYPTYDKALLDLSAGRIDAVVTDMTIFGYYHGIQPGTYRVLAEDLGAEFFGIAFDKSADAFRAKIQEALNALIADGTAKTISETWFGYDVTAIG